MPRTLDPHRNFANPRAVPAVELLAEHIRLRALPWTARRLVRRHGLRAATALTVAELAGFSLEGRR